jgi:integrase
MNSPDGWRLAVNNSLLPLPDSSNQEDKPGQLITAVGQAANQAAIDYLFADYRQRRAAKTIRTQTAALILWVRFLDGVKAAGELVAEAEIWNVGFFDKNKRAKLIRYAHSQHTPLPIIISAHFCQHRPEAWRGVTWGLVEGFVEWLLNEGYSVSSVNNRLSAVKVYARLATKAGVIPPTEAALIREVRGYGATEGKRVDKVREQTRVGNKKEEAIVLTAEQARQMKANHPPTPHGVRDRRLLTVLLVFGLRASEVAGVRVGDFAVTGYVIV